MIHTRRTMSGMRITLVTLVLCTLVSGCVRRTVRITTEPSGALIWLNHQEIGRTPVEVDFTHTGTYDLVIRKKGWEPIISEAPMGMSIYTAPGIDLALEVMPLRMQRLVEWHIELVPRDQDHAALIERADDMRAEAGGHDPNALVDSSDESQH